LREREQTGRGQRVGSALFESAAFLMSTHMAGMAATGLEARPMPARRGAWAIYEVFRTADNGQLFIGVTSDQQWARFVEVFALQELASDPRLATNLMRLQERAWLIPVIQDVLGRLSQQDVEARCEQANVSWARVGQPGDLFADPHLLATGGLLDVFISRIGGAEGKKVGLPALPIEFGPNRDRPGIWRQAPRIGEHSRDVLNEAGLSAGEVANLLQTGCVRLNVPFRIAEKAAMTDFRDARTRGVCESDPGGHHHNTTHPGRGESKRRRRQDHDGCQPGRCACHRRPACVADRHGSTGERFDRPRHQPF
jgi:crotonobetainyl-CoA:carnitine CoA-transferase CaiB-like acyl-CoA transferase